MIEVSARLLEFEGAVLVPPTLGPDPVNAPMIRHWTEVMGGGDSAVVDPKHADGSVAPAAMLQVWTMKSYTDKMSGIDPSPTWTELIAVLDDAGFTSVVATDSDMEFFRELRPGDHLQVSEVVEAISGEKKTGLGVGHFITTLKTYRDTDGMVVGTQRWRTLRYRPAQKAVPRALRPRPALNDDNAFWFSAALEHRLVIQRCTSCGVLRHPTGPMCGQCQSTDWDTVDASGRGHVYSFVVNHHPQIDAFDYPLIVAVIELEEGTRLVANMTGIEPADVTIDMAVELTWIDADSDLTLPAFRPISSQEH